MNDTPGTNQNAESKDIRKTSLKFLQIVLMLAGVYFIVERATYYAIMFFTS